MSKQAKAIRVDIDAAVDGYNSIPGNEQVSKNQFHGIWGVSSRTVMNWQRGDALGAINKLNELIKLSGLEYEDLVKPKK